MSPVFAPDGGVALALLRGSNDAGVLSVFGGTVFRALVLPPALVRWQDADRPIRRLDRAQRCLLLCGVLLASCSGFGWLMLQSGAMAGATGIGADWRALPTVLRATRFGHLMLLQLAVLALLAATLRFGRLWPLPPALSHGRLWPLPPALSHSRLWPLPPALLLVVLQALHGHAMAMTDPPVLLLPAGILHLLAGGVWLGGLVPLLLVVRLAPPRVAAAAAWSFSVWGKPCVLLMAATAAIQGWILVGSIRAALDTAYGWTALLKLVLFGVLLGFACLNRYALAPSLLRADTAAPGRQRLLRSIALQSVAGLAVVLAAGLLADLPPGMRMNG